MSFRQFGCLFQMAHDGDCTCQWLIPTQRADGPPPSPTLPPPLSPTPQPPSCSQGMPCFTRFPNSEIALVTPLNTGPCSLIPFLITLVPSHTLIFLPAQPAEAAADGEEAEAPKPKAKNPLDLLPPSPMVLDAWKRLYSNTKAKDFREVAIKGEKGLRGVRKGVAGYSFTHPSLHVLPFSFPSRCSPFPPLPPALIPPNNSPPPSLFPPGFWDMYDPEGYSLWFCDYKYNEENTVRFVTLNKVSGFLQRMDLARKYAFAKMCILGPDAGPFVIKGVWLFRGADVPQFVMDECYDCELYEWTKVRLARESEPGL
ncbi:unnamed protein product [Closterium sp. NIES-53]